MTKDDDNCKQLKAPFPAAQVGWRIGTRRTDHTRGKAVPYLLTHALQERLDTVLGPANWRNSFVPGSTPSSVVCSLELRIGAEWLSKSGAALLVEDGDKERSFDDAYAEAFRLAAEMWSIGRYLRAFDAPWVDLEQGRLKTVPKLPDSMLPSTEQAQAGKPGTPSAAEPVAETATPAAQPAAAEPVAEVATPAAQPAAVEPAAEAATPAAQPAAAEPAAEAATPAAQPAAAEPPAAAAATANVLKPPADMPEADQEERRASDLVDQEMAAAGVSAPSGASTSAQASAQAGRSAQDNGEVPAKVLAELATPESKKYFAQIMEKLKGTATDKMLRNYLEGDKVKTVLPAGAVAYLLSKLDARRAAAELAGR